MSRSAPAGKSETTHLARIPDKDYFEVSFADSKIVLAPLKIQRLDALPENLLALGVVEADDQKFISLAVGTLVDAMISGDAAVLALAGQMPIPTLAVNELRTRMSTG